MKYTPRALGRRLGAPVTVPPQVVLRKEADGSVAKWWFWADTDAFGCRVGEEGDHPAYGKASKRLGERWYVAGHHFDASGHPKVCRSVTIFTGEQPEPVIYLESQMASPAELTLL